MTYFIILGRKPNTTGWEYLGEEASSDPEEAAKRVLDGINIKDDYEIRVIPTTENDAGGPFWYIRDDLNI